MLASSGAKQTIRLLSLENTHFNQPSSFTLIVYFEVCAAQPINFLFQVPWDPTLSLISHLSSLISHLSAAVDIVYQPDFEPAVSKVQSSNSTKLTKKKAKSFYLINAKVDEDETRDAGDFEISFLDETLGKAADESAKRIKKSCPNG